jgi:hypothetical protein
MQGGMRKSLWIILSVVFAAIGAAGAHAGTVTYNAVFTCTPGPCLSTPTVTDNPVSFSSPTLDFTWDTLSLTVTLYALDSPTDTYEWVACPTNYASGPASNPTYCVNPDGTGLTGNGNFNIIDANIPLGSYDSFYPTDCPGCASSHFDYGTLTFTELPEPSSLALMLSEGGLLGLLMVLRKRIPLGHRRAS